MMNFLIWYVPTILFALIFITGLLMGLKRGFRKSVILAIHATVAFIICLVAYLIIVNDKATDANIVSLVNNFMGEQGLQRAILGQGDYSDITTLTGIITQFILKQQTIDQGIALMLTDDGVYLASLVYQIYRLIFAIIFIFIYLILVFILYLVYFFFYPDRRYYKKKRKAMEAMQTEASGIDNGEEAKDKLAIEAEEDDNTDSVIDEPVNNSSNPEYDLAPKEDSIDVTDEIGDDLDEDVVEAEVENENEAIVEEVEVEAESENEAAIDEGDLNVDDEISEPDSIEEDTNDEILDSSDAEADMDETESMDEIAEDENIESLDEVTPEDSDAVFVADLNEADFKDEHNELDVPSEEINTNSKNKKKTNNEVNLKKIGKRRRWIGMIIGGVRGFTSGLVILALFGAIFYMVSGTGKNKYSNENYFAEGSSNALYYDIYKSMGEYGNHGMYAVLNSITDKSNYPYYLYLVDVVYSGSVDDPEVGKYSYNLAKEMGNFTTFGRKAMDLLLKYSSADIVKFMDQNVRSEDKKDMLTIITDTFKNEEFNAEFNALIDEFEAGTYFFNMSLAFINSLIKNIDKAGFAKDMPTDAYEAICILFKKGYYSDYIPSEKIKKTAIEEAEAQGRSIEVESEACITVRNLLSKEDVKELINVVVDILSLDKNDDTTTNVINYSNLIIPSVQKLSILSSDKKEEMNPVLKRMYLYLENRYLQESLLANQTKEKNNLLIENYINSVEINDVDWINELQQLLVVAKSTMNLYGNIYTPGENDILAMIADEFDITSTSRANSLELLADVKNGISQSKLLDMILSTNGIYLTVSDFLTQNINKDAYLTSNITYSNTYDANGNIVEYGELYNLLTGLEAILKSENEKQILTSLTSMENASSTEVLNNIKLLINAFGDEELDTILTSDLLNSVLSAYLIANKTLDASSGLELYIPNSVLESVDGKTVNLIKKDQVKTLFTALNSLLDGIIPYVDKNSEYYNDISVIIDSLDVNEISNSKILEGTLANVIINVFNDESMKQYVTLPDEFKETQYWSKNNSGEIENVLRAVKDTSLDLNVLTSTDYKTDKERTDAITKMITSLSSNDINTILESNIFYLTISGILSNKNVVGDQLKVPSNIYEKTIYTSKGNVVEAIFKTEIKELLNAVTILDLDLSNMNNLDVASLIDTLTETTQTGSMKVDLVYKSLIIQSLITEQLLSNENVIVPQEVLTGSKYVIDGKEKNAIANKEIDAALIAIKKLDLDLNNLNNLDIDALVKTLNKADAGDTKTKLEYAYDSLIVQSIITNKLLEIESLEIPDEVLSGASYTIGTSETKNAMLLDELKSLVDTVVLLDLDLANLNTLKVSSLVSKLVETDSSGVMNVDKCYSSITVKAIITKNLLDNGNISIPEEVITGSTYTIKGVSRTAILDSEVKSAIVAVDKLNLDLDNINNINVQSLLSNFNTLDTNNRSNLDYCYDSLIISSTVTTKVKEYNSIKVPESVLTGSEYTIDGTTNNVIVKSEVKAMVDAVNCLSLNLNTISETNITIKLDEADVSTISGSKIIQNTLSYNLSSSNDLVIPAYLFDLEGMIEDNEYTNLLTVIAKNKEMFFTVVDGKFNVTKVSFSTDTVKFGTIKELINDSNIIYATALYNVLNNGDATIPQSYLASAAKTTLVNNYKAQAVVIDDELNKFIDAALIAYGTETTLSSITSFNTSNLISNLDGKVNDAYKSHILAATIESKVSSALTDIVIPFDAINRINLSNGELDYKQIDDAEMQALINLAKDKDLALDFDNFTTSFNFTTTNISVVSSSKIIRATLYLKIKDVNEVIIPDAALSGKLYEATSDKYLSEEETSTFLGLVVSNKVSLGLAANETSPITINNEMGTKVAEGVKNLTVSKLIELLDSDIFHATVINNIGSSSDDYGIIIPTSPDNYYSATLKENLINNFYSNVWYKNEETKTTLNALGHFIGFDKELSSLGDLGTNLNNYVKHLNEPIEEGSSTTKLDEIYSSVVMRATLSKEVCNLSTIKVPYDVIDSEFTYIKDAETKTGTYLVKVDIKVLIDVLNDSDLALDLKTVNLNNLNITDNNIELISSSRILRSTIYNHIIETMNEELVVPYYTLSGDYLELGDHGYINEGEMKALLTQLNNNAEAIGIRTVDGKLNLGGVNVDVSNLDVSVLKEMIISSDIFHATAISKMPEVTGIAIPKSYNDEAVLSNIIENYETLTWYTTNELINLLNALTALGIESIPAAETLDIDDTINNINSTKIDSCYKSLIMKLTLADKVNAIDSLIKPTDAYDETSYVITDIKSVAAITKEEFNALVNGIKAANVNVSAGAGNITLNEDSSTLIPKSLILNATLSKNINENDSIVVPTHIKNSNGTIDNTELTLFLTAVYKGFGINNLSGIGANTIKPGNIQNRDAVLDSIIMRATLSDNITKNTNIITPSSVVDTYGIITKAELNAFLDAIITGFGINDLSAIDETTVSPANIKDNDKVASSMIMRATITSKVDANGATNIYVSTSLCDSDTDYSNNNSILVLSKTEVVALLSVITTGTDFEVSITAEEIATMNWQDIEKYMASNIFAINISKALIDAGYSSIQDITSQYTLDNGETYELVQATAATYKLKSPKSIEVVDILAPSQAKTTVSLLTTNDVLAYKYYVSNHII